MACMLPRAVETEKWQNGQVALQCGGGSLYVSESIPPRRHQGTPLWWCWGFLPSFLLCLNHKTVGLTEAGCPVARGWKCKVDAQIYRFLGHPLTQDLQVSMAEVGNVLNVQDLKMPSGLQYSWYRMEAPHPESAVERSRPAVCNCLCKVFFTGLPLELDGLLGAGGESPAQCQDHRGPSVGTGYLSTPHHPPRASS